MRTLTGIVMLLTGAAAETGEWSGPADVLYEMKPCVTYRARVDGNLLVVEAALQPGWHTFAIDNESRAAEKRAGKPSLGIDQPTQIKVGEGLEVELPWYQLPPMDFSKPALRWYSWGFEKRAVFAVRIREAKPAPIEIKIRGQACTESTCKNVDVALVAPASGRNQTVSSLDLKTLVPAR